jgi:hypothetical protein
MQLAGEQRCPVMMLETKDRQVVADDRGLERRSRRWIGIDLELHRERLGGVGREAQLVKQAAKPEECALDGLPVVHARVHGVPLGGRPDLS